MEPISGDLLADTLNNYYLYKNAVVNIHSRNYFDAQGIWDYTNANGTSTPIRVDTIVPVEGVTHGYAQIADNSEFRLSNQFGFQGRLTLKATDEFGYYDGQFALLGFDEPMAIEPVGMAMDSIADEVLETVPSIGLGTFDSIAALNRWFVSATHINPADIRIPINMERIQEQDPRMTNGLYYELAIDGGYFGSFLTPKEGRKDLDETAPANGMLWYDADSLRFVVTDTTRFDTYVDLNSRGVVSGEGTFGLGIEAPLANFLVHGRYTQYPNDSLTLQGLNVFNAPIFDDKALEAMAEVYANADGNSIDLTQTQYLHYYRSENSEEKTDERRQAIELEGYPEMKSSDFYCNTVVIPDLKLVWNDKLHAFVSVGKIGLGNFGNHIVNKYVDGCVVFDRRLGNITYYFQHDMFQTFINYNSGDGQFQVHCTYSDINQRLSEMKEKNRTRKKDDQRFQYVAVPYESMLDFLNRLKYAGLSVGTY